MGNCLSSKAVSSSSASKPNAATRRKGGGGTGAKNHHHRQRRLPSDDITASSDEGGDDSLSSSGGGGEASAHGTTDALIHTLLPVVLPKVRRSICEHLIEEGFVTRDDEPILGFDENAPNDEEMPLRPIEARVEKMRAVTTKALTNDMDSAPQFRWPERDRASELTKKVPGVGSGMIVLDLIGCTVAFRLGEGVKLTFPVEGAAGVKATVEVGSRRNAGDDEPCIEVVAPKLRVWFVNETRRLSVAFMERPNVTTNLYSSVDRGNGDLDDIVSFDGEGSLDVVIQRLLYRGFSPGLHSAYPESEGGRDGDMLPPMESMCNSISVSDAIEKKITEAVGGFDGEQENARPFDIELGDEKDVAAENNQEAAEKCHKARTEAEIRAEIDSLKKELALAKARNNPIQSDDDKSWTEENSTAKQETDRDGACLSISSCLGDIRMCFQE